MDFKSGDTVRVSYKIKETATEAARLQPFEGVVLAIKGEGDSKTFTVRHLGPGGVGVERIFPFQSPNLEKVEVLIKGKTRRSKVYFVRNLSAKEIRRKLS